MEKVYKPVPDVEELRYKSTLDKPDIKIFVSHRIDLDSETINNPLYIPVRCGAVYDERKDVSMLGDDTGDNISEKRLTFNEFTVMYWAWKNTTADYYGLCHYRRYLSFFGEDIPSSTLKQGIVSNMSHDILEYYGFLDENNLRDTIQNFDVVVPYEYHMKRDYIPNSSCRTIREQWEKYCSSYLKPTHFELLTDLIKKHSPQYYESAHSYMNGKFFRGFNCFIMKKTLFHELCEFIFPILFEFSEIIDRNYFSETQNRAAGYLGEWLFSIFIYHLQKQKKYRISERQLISFSNTEKNHSIRPKFNNQGVAVAIPLDGSNRPLAAVTLETIIENSSDRNYDIIFLQRSFGSDQWIDYLKKQQNSALCALAEKHSNVSLRFYDPKDALGILALHECAETALEEEHYYLHLCPWIFSNYEKVIFLRPGMLLNTDILQLLNDNPDIIYAAAPISPMHAAIQNGYGQSLLKKSIHKISLSNPYNYVETDLVVMNLAQIRHDFDRKQLISFIREYSSSRTPADLFNYLFEKGMRHLHQKWNRVECADPNYFKLLEYIPETISKEIKESAEPSAINLLGMSGVFPPQQSLTVKRFWKYAQNTPFYEELLLSTWGPQIFDLQVRTGVFDTRSGIRKLADVLIPPNSFRRRVAKVVLPKGSLRWRFCKQIYYIISPKYRHIN